jgi:hypothetical protein
MVLVPYNYTIEANTTYLTKKYCALADWKLVTNDDNGLTKNACEADGWTYTATSATAGTLTYTFYKTFTIPLNVLN